MTKNHLSPDQNGKLNVPDAPGLDIEPDLDGIAAYVVDTEIRVGGKVIFATPSLG